MIFLEPTIFQPIKQPSRCSRGWLLPVGQGAKHGAQAAGQGPCQPRALPPKQGSRAGHSHVGPRAQMLEQSPSNNTGQAKKSVHTSGPALVMTARFRPSSVAARSTETGPEQGISLQARGHLSEAHSQAKLQLLPPSRPQPPKVAAEGRLKG